MSIRSNTSTATGASTVRKIGGCRVNHSFKEIYKTVLTKPDETSSQFKPYDHDPMVNMNDYTKNISQSIFNPGEL